MFEGTYTALITPFRQGALDCEALRRLVERQIEGGIHGLVVLGTTGEASAMTHAERISAVRHVVEQARGRVPVVVGTGTQCTQSTVEATREMTQHKIDGVLVVTPFYVKPTQAGLLNHFGQVAEVGLKVVVYNVPSRTGVTLTAETAAKLAAIPNVVALKEASGDMKLGSQILEAAGARLKILSGDDFTYLPLLALGGHGCISVVSNVCPRAMVDLFEHWRKGEVAKAQEIHHRLFPLMEALFTESNPIPVKAAMALIGHCDPEIRPPLTALSEQLRPRLAEQLDRLGLTGGAR